MSLAPASPTLDIEAVRGSLKEQPDGVLDDIARRNGVPLRVVFDCLPEGAARSAVRRAICRDLERSRRLGAGDLHRSHRGRRV